jgi:3-hydroxybutyryl-CoA dehydrogenase
MGAGIAEVCARAGKDVVVAESSPAAAEAGRARLERSMARAEERGKIVSAAGVMARIRVVNDLDQLADRDLVIEAIVEDEAAKSELFAKLDQILISPEAIMASNTSSIPIMKLAVATNRPRACARRPLLQPAPVLSLVELVPSLLTSPRHH